MHSKRFLKSVSTVVFLAAAYFLFSNFHSNSQLQDESANSGLRKVTRGIATSKKTKDSNEILLSDEGIIELVNSLSEIENFEKTKLRIENMPRSEHQKISHFLTSRIYPVKDLKFSLRALDILRELYKKDPSLASDNIYQNLEALLSEGNPLLFRGGVRVLGQLKSDQSATLLVENIRQTDSSLSAEVMSTIAQQMPENSLALKKHEAPSEIIHALSQFETNEQDNVEIRSAAVRALLKMEGQESFDFLVKQLYKSDVNLSLKNEIAESLPRWGSMSQGVLTQYLAYLRALKQEQNSLVDQDRLAGIRITEAALRQIRK